MTSRHALDAYERTVHLGFNSHVGTHGLSHLDALLVWYTLRVILFVGGKFSCGNVHFRMNSSFRTPLVLTSLYLALLFCHIKHGTSFSDSIILYINCISVDWQFIEWLCYLRIHSFVLHFPAKIDTVSHPENAWNIGSTLDFANPNDWLIPWAARYPTFFPVTKVIHNFWAPKLST